MRHFIGGDAVFVEAAGLFARVEHGDVVPAQRQRVRAGEPRRPGADHRDFFPRRGGAGERVALAHLPVGGDALQRADADRRTAFGHAHAGPFAQNFGGAHAGATAAENIRVQDFFGRTGQIAGGDAADEAGDVDIGRAGFDAGRVKAEIATICLDDRLGLGERRVRVGEIRGDPFRREFGERAIRHDGLFCCSPKYRQKILVRQQKT